MPDNVTTTADADVEVVTGSEMRELMLVVRRALLMILRWIEDKYDLA